jgi:UDP-N-acetylglucosamine 2-epimerase (non-hydrolysing)
VTLAHIRTPPHIRAVAAIILTTRLHMKIVVVAGARPNFMKVAPILAELRRYPEDFQAYLVHTGQHYDFRMSDIFFQELGVAPPDRFLQASASSPVEQTADIMLKFSPVLDELRPDLVMVVGDVTSTPACALVASKQRIPIAHLEAGLRSGDRTMPEELNRIVTDGLADLLLTPSADADANLLAENVPAECIQRIGNVMIDTLLRFRPRAAESDILVRQGLEAGAYGVITLHRPANVDDPETLRGILSAFDEIQQQLPLLFVLHPRTRSNLERFGMYAQLAAMDRLQIVEPLGYLDMLRLQEQARLVLTDSGGVQEETTVLGVPCLTIRENTERPVTITEGTNVLVGCRPERIIQEAMEVLQGRAKSGSTPQLWDGHTAERLIAVLRGGICAR